MPDVPLHFRWEVAQGGYRWLESNPIGARGQPRQLFLTPGRPIGAGSFRVKRYQPLSAFSGLFRVFADTEPSRAGIMAFASRFGLLGRNLEEQIPLCEQPGAKRVPVGTGERLTAWTNEIRMMRNAVHLWEAARSADLATLERVIHWRSDGSGVEIVGDPVSEPSGRGPTRVERGWIAGGFPDDELLQRLVKGDLIRPALYHVQSMINEGLRDRASPRLLWDTDHERLGLYIVPDGLIGALWVQFARAVERDSQFRKCAECGIWFELAPGTARADKLYCSTPCRTRAYRKRQAEAVRLHGEGRSIEEIARQLESEADTVHGWITRHSGETRSGRDQTS